VARNGRVFMNQLAQRESRNPQFDFLKPAHPVFPFFTKLVEQFTKVLLPPHITVEILRENQISHHPVLKRVQQRASYAKWEEAQRQREIEVKEVERAAYSSIDWHDIVVVQVLDFTEGDLDSKLPPPTSILALQNEAMQTKRSKLGLSSANAVTYVPPERASTSNEVCVNPSTFLNAKLLIIILT
jgi:splicing factor 3A subunit 1